MNTEWNINQSLLYGGDYNPDQWLNRPDILEADLKLMKEAGITVVSLGIFAWSTLEPEEGVFCFEWLDKIIDDLHQAGVSVFLATPSGARPAWMAAAYPEVLRVSPGGQRNLFGERHNHCFSSPVYREKTRIINTLLAKRYSDHPAVILWHISNEYSGECHCELCQENFRVWLKKRYGSLESLNQAWWNSFWSHSITDWSQLHSPQIHGETSVHGLNLDWKRFTTFMTIDFMNNEVDAVRSAGSKLPVTTNMMLTREDEDDDPGLDYWKFKGVQDIASWDSYPAWHLPGYKVSVPDSIPDIPADDYRRASEVAFQHDLYRNLSDGPFLLMESTPSKVNWQKISKNKRPGMNILSSLHAVAHGSNSVQYFQWRQGRGSFEKFHGAVVDQGGSSDTAVFREASELGSMLSRLKAVASTGYNARVALIYNWESRWAFDDSKGPLNNSRKAYVETVRKHYFCLWDSGIQIDVISGDEPFTAYDIVVATMLYMVSAVCSENLKEFVSRGGCLFTTYYSAYVDETDLCFEGGTPGPLKEILGFSVEDIDCLHEHEKSYLSMSEDYPVQDYYEIIRPDSAQVLAEIKDPFRSDLPGFLMNKYGKGRAYHLAGRLDSDCLYEIYQLILSDCKVSGNAGLFLSKTENINIQIRENNENKFLFVMNFSEAEGKVFFKTGYYDVLDSSNSGQEWVLPPYGIRILSVSE